MKLFYFEFVCSGSPNFLCAAPKDGLLISSSLMRYQVTTDEIMSSLFYILCQSGIRYLFKTSDPVNYMISPSSLPQKNKIENERVIFNPSENTLSIYELYVQTRFIIVTIQHSIKIFVVNTLKNFYPKNSTSNNDWKIFRIKFLLLKYSIFWFGKLSNYQHILCRKT